MTNGYVNRKIFIKQDIEKNLNKKNLNNWSVGRNYDLMKYIAKRGVEYQGGDFHQYLKNDGEVEKNIMPLISSLIG